MFTRCRTVCSAHAFVFEKPHWNAAIDFGSMLWCPAGCSFQIWRHNVKFDSRRLHICTHNTTRADLCFILVPCIALVSVLTIEKFYTYNICVLMYKYEDAYHWKVLHLQHLRTDNAQITFTVITYYIYSLNANYNFWTDELD